MVLPRGNATRLSALPACHLQESDLKIGEVARLMGPSSQNSFGHWFRAAFGCTMTQ
jgi:transcriptional regulator GlxA family with amidase domain